MTGNKPSILIMAGGTGGHVFPGLAVADYLREQGWSVHWLGTLAGMEARVVPKADIAFHTITVKGLRRKGGLGWCLAPFQLLKALVQALKIIHHLKPAVVLGMGGFVSGPGGVAAFLLRCPLIIHEQNAILGFTNRFLGYLATYKLEAFPNAFPRTQKAIYTGNPVRRNLLGLEEPAVRFQKRVKGVKRLLILGGSQGAVRLNEILPHVIAQLPLAQRPMLWHQTGHKDNTVETTEAAYAKAGIKATVEPFIDDMAKAYDWADLVLCRAGASTITELTAVGLGSVLVPYPFAVDDHQTANAQFLVKAGAAYVVQQSDLDSNPQDLVDLFKLLLTDNTRLLTMANQAFQLAKRLALEDIAAYCQNCRKDSV